jgi:hypothetical protein
MEISLPESAGITVDHSVEPIPVIAVGSEVKVKALDPISSTGPPSRVRVAEWSSKGIMLFANRFLLAGTVVQLHHGKESSIWKVFCCLRVDAGFQVGLEFKRRVFPS